MLLRAVAILNSSTTFIGILLLGIVLYPAKELTELSKSEVCP